jgi:hypothetical protein
MLEHYGFLLYGVPVELYLLLTIPIHDLLTHVMLPNDMQMEKQPTKSYAPLSPPLTPLMTLTPLMPLPL